MRIIACVEHTRYYGSLDFTPIGPQENGHVLAEAMGASGKVHLDCHFCTWATSPAAEKALGSVGNPTERRRGNDANQVLSEYDAPEIVSKRTKKEKDVARDKKTPTTRDRRPSLTKTLNFEGVQVTLTIKGTFEALLACDPQDLEHIKALQSLMEPDGMDKGEA